MTKQKALRMSDLTVKVEDCYDPADYVLVHKTYLARLQRNMPDGHLSREDRVRLHELIDLAWNEATDSETVPHTDWSDKIIDRWMGLPDKTNVQRTGDDNGTS